MSHPFHLTITRVRCYSTNDDTGSDDLVGVMGPRRFRIGSFAPGDDMALEIGEVVPAGEFHLTIMERDIVDSDDEIGVIDLAIGMDANRTVGLRGGGAHYEISLRVQSVSDG